MNRTPYLFSDWQVGKPFPDGWDAADAVDDGWGKAELDAFMRGLVEPWTPPAKPAQPARPDRPAGPPAGPVTIATAGAAGAVPQARTVQQEQPESATVTHIHTRKTVKADDSWMIDLVTNDEGKIKPGVTKNWSLFLEHHPAMAGVLAFDAFKMRVMLMRCPPWEDEGSAWEPRSLTDRDYSEAVMWLEQFHMTPKHSNIQAVIQTVAEHSRFDRLLEYLEGLKWDGVARVARFATDYLGSADEAYSSIVSTRWLVSSTARGLEPGCKVDTMPILEGPQGAFKSSALRYLYGDDFFTDELSDITGKDAMMELQGVWGLEVGEMHRFSAAETNAVKKFLSRQTDRFRPPYGRNVIEAPRRVVLSGTINPEGNPYLRDPTGARRFWPLQVGRISLDAILRDRDQLWAEAVALYRGGTPWWVQADEREVVEVEQAKRTDVDVWVDMIAPMLKGHGSISQLEIFKHLGIPTKDANWQQASRVGRIMKKLGWVAARERGGGEDRVVFRNPEYVPPEKIEDW